MKLVPSMAFAFFLLGCGHSSAPCDGQCADASGSSIDGGDSNTDGGGSNTATLTWDAPATYTDGTPLTVAGYHVYYGTMTGVYGTPVDANTATTYVFTATSPATYYFAVTAYDSAGSESVPSTEVSKALE